MYHFILLAFIFQIHICNCGELHETILLLGNRQQPQTSLMNIQNILHPRHRCSPVATCADVYWAGAPGTVIICARVLQPTCHCSEMAQFVLPLRWRGQGPWDPPSNVSVFLFTIFIVRMTLLLASPNCSRTG